MYLLIFNASRCYSLKSLKLSERMILTIIKYPLKNRVVCYAKLSALISIRDKNNFYSIRKNGYTMSLKQMQHDQIIRFSSNTKNQIQATIKFA